MPSKERFQTRPMGRAFKRCLLSQNYQFWNGQQPKLRKLDFWFSGLYFKPTLTIETNGLWHGKSLSLLQIKSPEPGGTLPLRCDCCVIAVPFRVR